MVLVTRIVICHIALLDEIHTSGEQSTGREWSAIRTKYSSDPPFDLKFDLLGIAVALVLDAYNCGGRDGDTLTGNLDSKLAPRFQSGGKPAQLGDVLGE